MPIVGLEPSCMAVFRDELGNLFPNDEDARRQQRVYLLSEFLVHAAGITNPLICIARQSCTGIAIIKPSWAWMLRSRCYPSSVSTITCSTRVLRYGRFLWL